MKILLTGATGYIGRRLLFELSKLGHEVICCVRDIKRFNLPADLKQKVEVIEVDFLESDSLCKIPEDIDGAFYLIHSLSTSSNYEELELTAADNFSEAIEKTRVSHVVYLGEIINDKSKSKFLLSRKAVEAELAKGDYHFTSIRAGIIIGPGSSSFDIISDLVERTRLMLVPRWFRAKCQPIGIQDVMQILSTTIFNPDTFNQIFDIGGPDIVSFKDLLHGYADARGFKRMIIIVPLIKQRTSAFWLNLVTSISYKLAKVLISNMKLASICRNNDLQKILEISPIDYREAFQRALLKIEKNRVISSWKDSWVSGRIDQKRIQHLEVPTSGCFEDKREIPITNHQQCIDNIWRIGGDRGWYFANLLWRVRGFADKIVGGVGLNRGRKHPSELAVGEAIDFWRIIYANKEEGRLLLFAEMKIPGEAWLEFSIKDNRLFQIATFQSNGFWGDLYWYSLLPIHQVIFKGMIKKIAGNSPVQ